MDGLRNWSLGLLATLVAVTASYFWLDRPIALFVHAEMQGFHQFQRLTLIAAAVTLLALAGFVALALSRLMERKLSRFHTVLLLSGVSLVLALAVKDQLKIAFGRTWPETWVRNNPSFIRDGAFGFHPFHGGSGYASFPSGHQTMVCSVMAVFWICYPKFRPVYALCMAAVGIGLVGANFHFLSDVIAGGYLGISAGWFSVAMWEMGEHPVRPQSSARDANRTGPNRADV